MSNYDPIIGADIMSMLSVSGEKLDSPYTFGRVREITEYFSSKRDYKYEVLKVLSSKIAQDDKLQALWSYVQLQKQKHAKLKDFDPNDFENDVVSELNTGYLTLEKKKRISDDIKRRKEIIIQKEQTQQEKNQEKKQQNLIGELSKDKLDLYSNTLDEIDQLDLALNNFN
jgi:hypothetical protein